LTDIAFTLRVGREELDERLALVVSSVDELAERLSSWVVLSEEQLSDNGFTVENVYWGNARSGRSHSKSLPATAERDSPPLATLLEERRFAEIARLWVNGTGIPWPPLPSRDRRASHADAPRRISLPGYAFAGDRFWLPGEPNLKLAEGHGGLAPGRHPLLDAVDPALSLGSGVVFRKSLAVHKPIARDHVVRGQNLLPGVGCLEMVCAALKSIGIDVPYRIGDVVWLRPIVIGEHAEEILVSIAETESGDLRYAVRVREQAQGAASASGTVRRSHRSGEAGEKQVAIDPIRARCPQVQDKGAIYRRFRSIGIDYGAYFQSLESVHGNGEEALGTIRLPASFQTELEDYTLHPSVLDAALQTALLVDEGAATALPFSVNNWRSCALLVRRPMRTQ
jgi:polyketide synthase PksM/polyketide synthase PksN